MPLAEVSAKDPVAQQPDNKSAEARITSSLELLPVAEEGLFAFTAVAEMSGHISKLFPEDAPQRFATEQSALASQQPPSTIFANVSATSAVSANDSVSPSKRQLTWP